MPDNIVYKIETPRTIIRCYALEDAQMVQDAVDISIEHLRPWMTWTKREPETADDKIKLIRKFRGNFDLEKDFTFGIFTKDGKDTIGGTGLHVRSEVGLREIAYWINIKYANQGYATEATKALIKVGFEINNLKRIEIHCDSKNIASFNIPKKLGFVLDGTLRKRYETFDGTLSDMMIWSMFRDEYEQSPIKNFPIKAFDCINREIEIK